MGDKVLVKADQVGVIPDYAEAQELEQHLDELLTLLDGLVHADVVVVIGPRLIVGCLVGLGVFAREL